MNFALLGFGSFYIKIYGIFVAIAFAWGVWAWWKGLEKRRQDIDFFAHHFWKWAVAGLIGGRIIAFLQDPSIISRQSVFGIFEFWDGGFNGLAVVFFGVLAMFIDTKKHDINVFRWLDVAILPFLASQLVLDVGAFITGAWYGTPTNLPWHITYNTFGVDIVEPVHPVSLYAFLIHFGLIRWTQTRSKPWESQYGKLAASGFGLWSIAEGILQLFLRGDLYAIEIGNLFKLRISGLFYLIIGIALVVWVRKTYQKEA